MTIHDFLQQTFLGNTLKAYCWFLGIALTGLIFKRIISRLFSFIGYKLFQKQAKVIGFDKLEALLNKPLGLLILLITFYIAFDRLEFPDKWNLVPVEKFGMRMFIFSTFQIAVIATVTKILLRIVDFLGLILMYRASLTETKSDDQLVFFIKEAIKIIILILSFFFILGAVFKLNVASIVAGLGIGGLAIALAAKESLENLMGAFTIFLDQPFTTGDAVKIGAIEGTVERIGFRSTRIRTVEGTFLTVPNKKMVDTELDNLSLRTVRRVKFDITLVYETSIEQLKLIVADIQKIIDEHQYTYTENNRARMFSFGDSSINIMVIYFINTRDFDVYLNVRQEINYKIMEIVKARGSDFAFPSTTVYLQK